MNYVRWDNHKTNMNHAYGFRNQADQSSDDPHSSEAFKQNLRVALEYTTTLRENARRALTGM